MYEKKNIHLAEAAQILQRMIQYEIPALKKQISKSDQTITVLFQSVSILQVNNCACAVTKYNLNCLGLYEKRKRLYEANS